MDTLRGTVDDVDCTTRLDGVDSMGGDFSLTKMVDEGGLDCTVVVTVVDVVPLGCDDSTDCTPDVV